MTGTLSAAPFETTFTAARVPYSNSNPAPQAGLYTLLLSTTDRRQRTGDGCATMQVNPDGLVAISGRTETGAPFTTSSYLNAESAFPFYAVAQSPGKQPARMGSIREY